MDCPLLGSSPSNDLHSLVVFPLEYLMLHISCKISNRHLKIFDQKPHSATTCLPCKMLKCSLPSMWSLITSTQKVSFILRKSFLFCIGLVLSLIILAIMLHVHSARGGWLCLWLFNDTHFKWLFQNQSECNSIKNSPDSSHQTSSDCCTYGSHWQPVRHLPVQNNAAS